MSNPLIAGATNAGPSAWAGVWIAEDIESIVQGVQNGSWIDGTLGAVWDERAKAVQSAST